MLKTRFTLTLFLGLFVMMLGISGCFLKKGVKEKKDSSFISNISTKYNILFNSKELLQQAQKNTSESTADHYLQLLSVFREPNSSSIQQNKELMDSVIGKTNRIINDKQDSKYIGEAFLLKGQAYYHQGDYFNANELFDYVANNTENPTKLKHEALLWQIRSLLQLGNLSEATKRLDLANTLAGENKHLRALSSATQAKYSLVNNNKASAMAQLSQAIEYSPNKKDRLRWQFLIGQLLFERGENDLAYSYFTKVAKSNETYEMIFHTNLYRVEILNKAKPTVENRVSLLNKLLRDGKNKHYKGQIYQRIGDAYSLDNQLDHAIANYELATQNTINDPYQMAVNYQKLAELYFNEAKYTHSSAYYDSTVMVLPKENPAYEQLSLKQKHLTSLVEQLTTIAYQDTLIQLAALSAEAREQFIDKSIADNTPIEPISKKKKGNKQANTFTENQGAFATTNMDNPGFYFNSQAAISQGFSTFKKRWGNREAGNYWRYANQAILGSAAESEVATLIEETQTLENYNAHPRERYLQNLPDTPEKLDSANNVIKVAYLTLGDIYQFAISDKASAIKTYEDYLERFKNDENTALICFHLHRLYVEKSPEKAEVYKARLLQEFPSSTYSLTLNDPLYYQKQHDLLQQFNADYNQAYALFRSQDYTNLIEIADKIQNDRNFQPLEDNLAQLAYLRAIATGRTAPIDDFQTALTQITENYPDEKIVVPLVKQHLAYIDSNEAQFQNNAIALDELAFNRTSFEKEFALTPWPELSFSKEYNLPKTRREYDVNDGAMGLKINQNTQNKNTLGIKNIEIGQISPIGHENSYRDNTIFPDTATYYFVINVMHESVNLSPSRYGLGQFNRGNYPASTLNHQLKVIDDESQLIYIGNFSTFAEAKAYEQKINPLLNSIMKIPADLYHSFIVTEAVFNTFANFDQLDDYNSLYQTQQ